MLMSYKVLARKWRPQAFTDVVGQQHVLTALANGLSLGRIHHAYLFSGTRGVGKTTIARLLAKGLNCEAGITASPCGQCGSCREIEQGRFVDLLEIDAASRTKVEDTRELLDNVQYAPSCGRFKIYLIDEVHMLSRHSFNALLKTLEEPPDHVKFLLATTDPQKLPITILSRCLQFHLKVLTPEQIRQQLEYVLEQESVVAEPRALQLLARAADGSMRDGLSLTDQAIALGQGQITAVVVSTMLGTLDDDQPLALVEALVKADAQGTMTLLEQAASRGVVWETLLAEMLSWLHKIAMTQMLPGVQRDGTLQEERLRELARTLPPAEVQLYYQTLLVGRKELPYAPDPRMGIEMTLLRALAFHPQQMITESAVIKRPSEEAERASVAEIVSPAIAPDQDSGSSSSLPDTTSQLLKARTQLSRQRGGNAKKSEPAARTRPVSQKPGGLAPEMTVKSQPATPGEASVAQKKERYRWRAQAETESSPTVTPETLREAFEQDKDHKLIAQLTLEMQQRDPWAARIFSLPVSRLVQQLALNTWLEETEHGLSLHLRSAHRHLNSSSARQLLTEALSEQAGRSLELHIVEDDNPAVKTPLELRKMIYEEKLTRARQSISTDNHIKTFCCKFDAVVDEESIRPV